MEEKENVLEINENLVPVSNEKIPNEDDLFVRVKLDETESEHIVSEPYSYWKSVLRVFIRKPSAIIGLVCLSIMILGMIIIPMFAPEDAYTGNIAMASLKPSSEHLFGTDFIGRDLFFMCWKGLQKSLVLALITTAIDVLVGTLVGLAWGFFRKLDPILIEVYNLVSNIPSLLIYMLLAVIFSTAFPGMMAEVKLVIALSITSWIGVALFIRNQTLIITNRDYNIASKTLGSSPWRIMIHNLLPYLLAIVITELSLMIPGMISSEVSMSFFGVGLPNSTVSVGVLLNNGRRYFIAYPWQLLAPACTLAFVIFTFYLTGLALSDALDPKKHR